MYVKRKYRSWGGVALLVPVGGAVYRVPYILRTSAPPGRTVMTQNVMVPVDQLWLSIRHEAESALAGDPLFGASLSAAILDHPDFGSALAHQIGERLGKRA